MPVVGTSIAHDAAVGHVTGQAHYIEDLPAMEGELWVDFAGAPVTAGRIVGIDTSAALAVPGVVAIYTHADIDGNQHFGPIFHDEVFLAKDRVDYLHQPVAVIAATDRQVARRAAALVRVQCEQAVPLLEIDEAIAAGSYLGPMRRIERGDVESGLASSPQVIEGAFRSSGQEQFYFESQACQAIPGEDHQLKLISSTQNPTETQAVVAEVLGLGMHQVVCECKRMGGGFGGKETQSAIPALMVGLVALKTGRAARIVFRKDTDMIVTGKRHPYLTRYKVGFDETGRIIAAKFDFFSNGGAYADLSTSVMERTMMHCDNAYHLPHVLITGQVCKTNLPPNTAFRGFGGPQGVVVIENIMQEIAQTLQLDALDVRLVNLYRDGDPDKNTTPYGQVVADHLLPEMVEKLERSSDYRRRVKAIGTFNQQHATHLKGIALSTIKFGISFTSKFLNQGNALVNVFTDGTVQVSTGGTEMGQGLNTKIRQLVADEFGIDVAQVMLMTTSTEKNNNTSPTAASAGTDLNGTAAVFACQEIKKRMAMFAVEHLHLAEAEESIVFTDSVVANRQDTARENAVPFGKFCDAARRERVDLGQRSFYATPGVDFDRETGRGTPYYYFTTGAAVAEVTIDRFTGELVVDRVDVLMDIGQSINPGIDQGQVIGGFVQGMGWCTTEELVYDDNGRLLSTGPTTYKIPNVTDVPHAFHVNYIHNPKHKVNVRLSKAVGEPPLMLGIAPWLAVKHAMSFINPDRIPNLPVPATGEANLMCMTELLPCESSLVPKAVSAEDIAGV